jgi:hypothetical protein
VAFFAVAFFAVAFFAVMVRSPLRDNPPCLADYTLQGHFGQEVVQESALGLFARGGDGRSSPWALISSDELRQELRASREVRAEGEP